MFEELRDDDPPMPSQAVRRAVRDAAHLRQRRRRMAVGALATTPALVLGGGAWFVRSQLDEIDRISVGGLSEESTASDTDNSPVASTASPTSPLTVSTSPAPPDTDSSPSLEAPINILIVGLDGSAGRDLGQRADAMVIVRIDPIARRMAVLGIPRDLWVSVGDRGVRINALLTETGGDPTLLVTTLTDIVDIPIHHYVGIDGTHFIRAVDLASGVDVEFDRAVRDTQTGFTAGAGCVRLDGAAAWSYVRSRRVETLNPTTAVWEPDDAGPAGRVDRHLEFVSRLVGSVLAHEYSVDERVALLTDVLDGVTTDSGMRTGVLLDVFETARAIGAQQIDLYNLADAATWISVAGSEVLQPDREASAAMGRAFVDGAPTELVTGTSEPDLAPASACASP